MFNLQDTDKTVCAKVTGAQTFWRILWSNSNFNTVQNVPVGNGESTFTLTAASSLGDWRVILYDPFGGTVQGVTSFTVIDAANPVVDVQIDKNGKSNETTAGAQVVYAIQVTNGGPDSAVDVQLIDEVPANTTFVSFSQFGGPGFSCSSPSSGNTGSTVCTIASLARGDKAIFLATYLVDSGVPAGSSITNTATVSNTVSDSNPKNNSTTASVPVTASPCVITCPSNIVVSAASGQSGAIVNFEDFDDPNDPDDGFDTSGNCGTPISSNPASGSFFPLGTTTVTSTSPTGGVCTFQVTVQNPGGLAITLNGPNPLPLECGSNFADPAASAVNGTGQSIPVTVTYPASFDPAAPAVGSYEATYTATEGQNSVSTTRTINVSDSEAPLITLNGANPMTLSTGQTFIDPGASANDDCEGATGVTASDPSTVNTATPGTYTITYTASDSGNHTATATRTVIVQGNATGAPIITLDGGAQISIECGSNFVDPGAHATSGGTSVDVTSEGTVDSHTLGSYTITYTACIEESPGVCDPARTAHATRTVTVEDTTSPTIVMSGDNPMTVECHTSFTDPGATAHDGCAVDFAATASGTVDVNTVGEYIITYNATDPSGNPADPVERTVRVVDTRGPVVTAPADSSASADASCQAAIPDYTSGSTASDACDSSTTLTQSPAAGTLVGAGPHVVTVTATDSAGNHGSDEVVFTVNDTTAPVVTAPADSSASADANCQAAIPDYISGSTTSDACDAHPALTQSPAAGTLVGLGPHTVTVTATDSAGNHSSDQVVFTVNDTTAPTISCPSNITEYLTPNSTATSKVVNYTAPVGEDNCGGATTVQTGGLASGASFPVGTTTNTFTVTDAAGNHTDCSFTVTVLYNFTGFFSPVGNPPTLNSVNAGRAIPVKFSLSGNKGLNIFAAASPISYPLDCGTGAEIDVEETVTAGGSSLSYSSSSDQYNYVWKTESSWAGTCRQLKVTLNDGSVHLANFKFK